MIIWRPFTRRTYLMILRWDRYLFFFCCVHVTRMPVVWKPSVWSSSLTGNGDLHLSFIGEHQGEFCQCHRGIGEPSKSLPQSQNKGKRSSCKASVKRWMKISGHRYGASDRWLCCREGNHCTAGTVCTVPFGFWGVWTFGAFPQYAVCIVERSRSSTSWLRVVRTSAVGTLRVAPLYDSINQFINQGLGWWPQRGRSPIFG